MITFLQIPPCDAVVGPGNRFVTAAKQLVAGKVAIDMLAGPSECLVLADATANPELIAADLIAQAEHDPDARPILINVLNNTETDLVSKVEDELNRQLEGLPTAGIQFNPQITDLTHFYPLFSGFFLGFLRNFCLTRRPKPLKLQYGQNSE